MFAFFLTIIFTQDNLRNVPFFTHFRNLSHQNGQNSPDKLRKVHFFARFRNLSKSFLLILHAQNIMI